MTRARLTTVVCLLACLAITVPMFARQGAAPAADPLSGTWTGDWGPSAGDRNMVSVELKLSGTAVTGTVKSTSPARPDVALTKSTFTPATGVVHLEAEAKTTKRRSRSLRHRRKLTTARWPDRGITTPQRRFQTRKVTIVWAPNRAIWGSFRFSPPDTVLPYDTLRRV
jgi:hypothetical protein